MRVVGFDGKRIRRQDGFQALLGVGVTLTDYPRFTKEYNAIFERLFKKHGLERLKPIYKASELQGIFHGLGTEVIEEVATSLLSQINFIDIYYMHFLDPAWNASPRKQSIACFYKEKIKYLSPAKFIDLVEGKFPALCCYAHISSISTPVETVYFIDDCSTALRPSPAINKVIQDPSTRFLFKGDQVNYAVSCADLICRYIDDRCLREGIHFDHDLPVRLGLKQEMCKPTFIGSKWLHATKPERETVLKVVYKYPHPIFFFFKDDKGPFGHQTGPTIEKSRLYRSAQAVAAEKSGVVKFFEPPDQDFITENDFLVSHSNESTLKIEQLLSLDCPAKKIDIGFFKSCTTNNK